MSPTRRARSGPAIGYAPEGWRDPKNYPPCQSTSMRRWAGEFLIRNACFQEALGALRALYPHRRGERYRKTARQVADRFGLMHWACIQFRNEEPLIYPSFRVAPYDLEGGVRLHGTRGEWFLGKDEGWGRAFVFDLRRSIAPQLRAAAKLLNGSARSGVQRRAQRDRHADYQSMLRVLDARTMKVAWPALASVICPQNDDSTDRAKKLHARAVKLRDGGYLDLAFIGRTVRARS